jgi:hypothetical protein
VILEIGQRVMHAALFRRRTGISVPRIVRGFVSFHLDYGSVVAGYHVFRDYLRGREAQGFRSRGPPHQKKEARSLRTAP